MMPGGPSVMDDRRELRIQEAAALCGISQAALFLRCVSGDFPNARRDSSRWVVNLAAWRIPTEDLVAAGLLPNADSGAIELPGPQESVSVDKPPKGSKAAKSLRT